MLGLGRVLRLTILRRYTWLILFLPFRCLLMLVLDVMLIGQREFDGWPTVDPMTLLVS